MFSYHVQLLQFVIKFTKQSRATTVRMCVAYVYVWIEEMFGKLSSFNLECGILEKREKYVHFFFVFETKFYAWSFCYFAGTPGSHTQMQTIKTEIRFQVILSTFFACGCINSFLLWIQKHQSKSEYYVQMHYALHILLQAYTSLQEISLIYFYLTYLKISENIC